MKNKILYKGLYLLILSFLISPFHQINPADTKKEVEKAVKNVVNQFVAIAGNSKYPIAVKRKKIKSLYYKSVDIQKFARGAIRRGWKSLNAQQRTEYLNKFNEFVVAYYSSKVERYENNKITYAGVTLKSGGKSALAKTLIRYKNTDIALDYYMSQKKGKWYIYDFSIEGVRISSTYYSQFKQVLSKKGADGLNKELDKLIQKYKKR